MTKFEVDVYMEYTDFFTIDAEDEDGASEKAEELMKDKLKGYNENELRAMINQSRFTAAKPKKK